MFFFLCFSLSRVIVIFLFSLSLSLRANYGPAPAASGTRRGWPQALRATGQKRHRQRRRRRHWRHRPLLSFSRCFSIFFVPCFAPSLAQAHGGSESLCGVSKRKQMLCYCFVFFGLFCSRSLSCSLFFSEKESTVTSAAAKERTKKKSKPIRRPLSEREEKKTEKEKKHLFSLARHRTNALKNRPDGRHAFSRR